MYKVTCLYGGTTYTLHDPESDELRLYDDEIQTEDNEPGAFQFTVDSSHPYLDKIVGMSSDIRVFDDGEEIFRCRPVNDGEDLYRTRTFQCEGELAFLYDSIQPRRELHDLSVLQFFKLLLDEHNAQVKGQGPIDKTFALGIVTVTSSGSLFRYTNRETTLDAIRDKLISRLGGHLNVRIENGIRYLDILADVATVSDQPIQLGENLLDYTRDINYTQIATACIPLGERLEETEIDALDAYLTISSVNNKSEIIQLDEAVKKYGFICKVLHYDDITVPANLKKKGEEWLTDGQYAEMTLEMTAVDLHTLGYNLHPIRKNTQVRVVSEPHGMDRYFEVSKRTYHLTAPETDTVTIGNVGRQKSYTAASSGKISGVKNQAEQVSRKIDEVIEEERRNVSDLLNQATHGYAVLDPNDGPERILIMDTNSIATAQKIWKWDMNGLGYSKSGINGPWGTAITMSGQIVADYIGVGRLDASLIRTGRIMDVNGKNFWDMETGEFSLASTATVGGKTVSEIAENAVDSYDKVLTQTEMFKRLTNDGKVMGLFMKNGQLYMNAAYIASGILKDTKGNTEWDLENGILKSKKLSIDSTNFKLDQSGNLTSKNAKMEDAEITGNLTCGKAGVAGNFWVKVRYQWFNDITGLAGMTDAQGGGIVGGYGSAEKAMLVFGQYYTSLLSSVAIEIASSNCIILRSANGIRLGTSNGGQTSTKSGSYEIPNYGSNGRTRFTFQDGMLVSVTNLGTGTIV